ncbi:MAG TPA: ABC transporter substrate-binding protein [Solirubrobacterales bacterium]|jgi:branched-chain amino acid transport system substrate-binding protein
MWLAIVPKVFRRCCWLSLALTLALSLAGCGSDGDSTASSASAGLPETITIGAAIAKSGWLEPYDASISAVEQLVDEVNARGGIDGSKLEVIQVDNRSDPQQAPIAAQQAIEKGADALFFSSESLTASAAAPVAEENNALNFSLSANEPGFGPPTTGRLSFSAYPSVLSEASADATFLHEKGLERPFLFRDTAIIYGKAYCDGFQQAWERLGGSITGSVDFKNEDESIASQVNQLKKSNADSVVMCSYPPGGAAAVKQVRDAAVDLPIIATGSFDGTYWLKGISNTKDIYVATNGSSYDPPNEAAAKLFEKLEKTGVETDVSSVLLSAYAGGQLIVQAIEETGSIDGDALADALEARPHQTILGKISYTEDFHYANGNWPIYVYANGEPKLLTKITPRFVPEYQG